MRIKDLAEYIKSVELNMLNLSESQEAILTLTNMAIMSVYAELDVLKKICTINIVDGVTEYPLPQNILRLIEATDEDGNEIEINDSVERSERSVMILEPFKIRVSKNTTLKTVYIYYSYSPPFVKSEEFDTSDFVIPNALVQAIATYAGYQAYMSHSPQDKGGAYAYLKRYQMEIQKAQNAGILYQNPNINGKLFSRGFA